MTQITKLSAVEILDSRGRPTIKASYQLQSGVSGTASVPSGASTGKAEALELPDGDPGRYRGFGCLRAVHQINHQVNAAVSGKSFSDQKQFDQFLVEMDGTPNKGGLGANAILAASLAFARAAASENAVPLYVYFAELLEQPVQTMPRPLINLFSGGKHAGGQVTIQDVLVVPASTQTMEEALSAMFEIYQCAAELSYKLYGMRALTADEGGLAPPFPNLEAMFENTVHAVEMTGMRPGREIFLGIDIAASHFNRGGLYHLEGCTTEFFTENG